MPGFAGDDSAKDGRGEGGLFGGGAPYKASASEGRRLAGLDRGRPARLARDLALLCSSASVAFSSSESMPFSFRHSRSSPGDAFSGGGLITFLPSRLRMASTPPYMSLSCGRIAAVDITWAE